MNNYKSFSDLKEELGNNYATIILVNIKKNNKN